MTAVAATRATTVLVVEDDAAVRRIMARTLEHEGYRVLTAAGSAEGADLYARESGEIALVVADIMMPGLTGPEMIAELKGRYPEINVLYVSGYADERARAAVAHQGATLLPKPFLPNTLAEKVRELIARD